MIFSFLRKIFNYFDSHRKATKERIRLLEKIIGTKIQSPDIYIEALTHRSMLDSKKFKKSNERLEFLGDSILGFIVARELFDRFPDKDEGFLTKIRANFVNKNALFEAGSRIKLLDLIFIQNELMLNENFGKKSLLADAFEALIAAIYIDAGFEKAEKFILVNIIVPNLENRLHMIDDNFKSQLLELAQSLRMDMPRYYVVQEEGPEHDRVFTIDARIGSTTLGSGKGKNKKAAEQEAAKQALSHLQQSVQNSLQSIN